MAKNKNQSAIVSINASTLNCLKQLLFSDKDGVDLSNIIKDMSPTEEPDDMVAINIGLAFKGITPEVDNRSRFEMGWNRNYYRLDFVKYSLILNKVFYQKVEITLDAVGTPNEHPLGHVDNMSYENWLDRTTVDGEIIEKTLKQK